MYFSLRISYTFAYCWKGNELIYLTIYQKFNFINYEGESHILNTANPDF